MHFILTELVFGSLYCIKFVSFCCCSFLSVLYSYYPYKHCFEIESKCCLFLFLYFAFVQISFLFSIQKMSKYFILNLKEDILWTVKQRVVAHSSFEKPSPFR